LTITPVVSQEIAFAELLERIVETTGKDMGRIQRILRAGELSSGATRYRFAGWEVEPEELSGAMGRFPDPDPGRPLVAQHATKVVFHSASGVRIEMPREAGAQRRFLQKRSFWDSLLQVVVNEQPHYVEYSYKMKADCYRIQLPRAAAALIQKEAGLLAHKGLAQRLQATVVDAVDVYVPRPHSP
jgi:hypothetical protein